MALVLGLHCGKKMRNTMSKLLLQTQEWVTYVMY